MGVSKHMTRTQARRQTRGKGTDLWMAPEVQDTVAKGEQPTYGHPIDVFGFGLTAVFILTRREWLGRLGRKINGERMTCHVTKAANVSRSSQVFDSSQA